MTGKKRRKVRKEDLQAFLEGVTEAMGKLKRFYNVEVKPHRTQLDFVWVIIG